MKNYLIALGQWRLYWLALALTGIALECGALYYQYVLGEWPCVLCIHVRIWVVAFILLGFLAMFFTHSRAAMRLFHGLSVVIMIGLTERAWQVLAVERGWIFGDCELDLGMPSWFALDKWFPLIFEVQTSCGYTPLILFDITMAEVLLVISAALLLLCSALFVTSWLDENY